MRVLFMGTPDFALQSLKALCESHHEVVCVITQPDKPKGRGYELTPPPVKVYAATKNIPVYQPETLKNNAAEEILLQYRPDVIAVVAYGKLLPEYILDFPKYGCINIHGSLLPAYRGAAPIQRAVQNGERTSGVTSMYMNKGLDTGDMIFHRSVEIPPDMTGGELYDILAPLGGELLVQTLDALFNNSAPRTAQSNADATYAPPIKKAEGEIDWNESAQAVLNKIRAFNPWPMTYSFINGKRAVFDSARPCEGTGTPGEILKAENGEIAVACRSGAVSFSAIKIEGKKKMTAAEFLRGHNVEKGMFFKKG